MTACLYVSLRRQRKQYEKMPSKPFDVKKIGVIRLVHSDRPSEGGLSRAGVLTLWPNAKCTELLEFKDHVIAKLVAFDGNRRRVSNRTHFGRWGVYLVGKDETGQPFLLQLPPDYRNKTIEQCEKWVTHADEQDEIVETTRK
jgi:hypothetical protein